MKREILEMKRPVNKDRFSWMIVQFLLFSRYKKRRKFNEYIKISKVIIVETNFYIVSFFLWCLNVRLTKKRKTKNVWSFTIEII